MFDLTWINDLLILGQASNATKIMQITRAGRVSKLGARTARFIRIIRLIRMLRLYKNASASMTSDQEKRNSVRSSVLKGELMDLKRMSSGERRSNNREAGRETKGNKG
jgi:hypothetical protein